MAAVERCPSADLRTRAQQERKVPRSQIRACHSRGRRACLHIHTHSARRGSLAVFPPVHVSLEPRGTETQRAPVLDVREAERGRALANTHPVPDTNAQRRRGGWASRPPALSARRGEEGGCGGDSLGHERPAGARMRLGAGLTLLLLPGLLESRLYPGRLAMVVLPLQ
ncbi:hypothetical protein AAFF_G00100020 [Aldrovandia affinis]|uniref:Uncharacterized protein n=1 Tax=Aldrovandia affinis TaxID=143900 RepID=A0AAD7WBV1_9TELE|nr:hypothetical protein AAFF_G00100020 [Aldrovandia affinis]